MHDDLWALIEPLLPPWPDRSPGPKPVDDRLCLQGILYVLCNDIARQLLPLELGFGSGQTCWRRLGRWQRARVFDQPHRILLAGRNAAGELDWSRVCVDGSHIRAKKGALQPGRRRSTGGKTGSKRHLICDGKGTPLKVMITAANVNDVTQTRALVDSIPPVAGRVGHPRMRPETLLGDKAYGSRAVRGELRTRRILPVISHRGAPNIKGLGKLRYVVEQTFALLHQFKCLAVRWEHRPELHDVFRSLACSPNCWRRLKKTPPMTPLRTRYNDTRRRDRGAGLSPDPAPGASTSRISRHPLDSSYGMSHHASPAESCATCTRRPSLNEGNIMSTPSSSTEGLSLPAERLRRGGFYLALVLAGMLCLVLLEGLVSLVINVLIMGEGIESMGWMGVGGYVGLPVIGGVVTLLPLLVIVWLHPGLRIDSTGMSKVWRHRTETVRWADIDKVQFNSRRSYLLLVLKPGAHPGKPNGAGRPRVVLIHSLGQSLWSRRRPTHPDLIIGAVERFAPGMFTVERWNLGKGGAKGAGTSA
ncbi:IS5 family transposase [Streptomyces sp. NPDC079020]|uniref:IS5 family transposase n=1 Tax=Streptomyces sp. NPDC079020 TaxID=3365722 RepID=UPI0037D1C057